MPYFLRISPLLGVFACLLLLLLLSCNVGWVVRGWLILGESDGFLVTRLIVCSLALFGLCATDVLSVHL